MTSMMYHDYDPHKRHDGWTCLACGTEQPVNAAGDKSVIPTSRPIRRRV